jgi:hypothetical protein
VVYIWFTGLAFLIAMGFLGDKVGALDHFAVSDAIAFRQLFQKLFKRDCGCGLFHGNQFYYVDENKNARPFEQA